MRKWWIKACAVLIVLLAFALLPGLAFAAEPATSILPEGSPWWAHIVYVVVTALVGTLALPYLARKAQAAKQEIEKLKAEGLANGINARSYLVADLKRFLIDYCSTLLEKRLPAFLPLIIKHKRPSSEIKAKLKAWGAEAKCAAISYFKTQGLDIAALVGDAYLDQAVRWAADQVSPFPGAETAVKLVQEKYTNWIIEKGIDYVRNQWSSGGTPDVPVKTPTE